MKLIKNIVFFALLTGMFLCLYGCANQIPLTGGPKDETPPELDTVLSFKNEQVNFVKEDINLYFDEFVELKNATKQIVVSPPLTYLPATKGRGKKISFLFNDKETLKEDATYVINFGEAISDYTQGNKLENFTLVFSTGDYIDSLSIKGKVIEAKSQKASEAYTVMLYENTADSVVYNEKPFYFAKTDENGLFEIKNLRSDTFKLFVLNDKNLNYTYDPINEEIGFIDELIILNDTSDLNLQISTFKEKSAPLFVGYKTLNKGLLELEFDVAPKPESLTLLDTMSQTSYRIENSGPAKLNLWYQDLTKTTLSIAYMREETIDTISIRINLRSVEDLDTLLNIALDKTAGGVGQHPDQKVKLSSNYPIESIDISKLTIIDTLLKDTIDISAIIDSTNFRSILLDHTWEQETNLNLTLLPGFAKDIWGHLNDTTEINLEIASRTDFGTINITTINVPSDTAYIVNLYKGDKLIVTNSTSESTQSFLINELIPGEYQLEIIEDINKNGEWDPGVYLQKRYSERIFEKISLEKLRENWTLEYQLDIDQLKSNSL